jgi:hemerythrin
VIIELVLSVQLIDEQHQKLVELLNMLDGHLAYQSDASTFNGGSVC